MNLEQNRKDCLKLTRLCLQKEQPLTEIEARIHFAKFVALERMLPSVGDSNGSKAAESLATAKEQLRLSHQVIATHPSTLFKKGEIEAVETMLRDSTFYTSVTSAEMEAVYKAMAQDFQGTGHWYHCQNGHLVSPKLINAGNRQ